MQLPLVAKLLDISKLTGKYLSDMVTNIINYWNDHDSGVRAWTVVNSGVFQQAGSTFPPILQVVSGSTSTSASSSSATYADSNLTASITPKATTSQILVMISQCVELTTTGAGSNCIGLKLLRGASTLGTNPVLQSLGATPVTVDGVGTFFIVDSPASTSALTYKTQFASIGSNLAAVKVQPNPNAVASTSTILLLELGF